MCAPSLETGRGPVCPAAISPVSCRADGCLPLSFLLRPAADDRHAGCADGHSQEANYDALLTHPEWDEIIRHPAVYPLIEALMGGATCLGEIGLRTMPPWEKEFFQGWHRGTRRLLPAAAVRLPDRSSMTQTAPTRRTTPSGWTTCR